MERLELDMAVGLSNLANLGNVTRAKVKNPDIKPKSPGTRTLYYPYTAPLQPVGLRNPQAVEAHGLI